MGLCGNFTKNNDNRETGIGFHHNKSRENGKHQK